MLVGEIQRAPRVALRTRPDHLAHHLAAQVHHHAPARPDDVDMGGRVVVRVDYETQPADAEHRRHEAEVSTARAENPSAWESGERCASQSPRSRMKRHVGVIMSGTGNRPAELDCATGVLTAARGQGLSRDWGFTPPPPMAGLNR